MNAFVIDAFEFCRLKERLEGEIPVADLPRLAEESIDKSGVVRWILQGGSDKRGHLQLDLTVCGKLSLMCQRCLTSFGFDVESEARLILARDESSADEIDLLLADESVEVIVGSRNFDIMQVIEDEALLTIPLSPKHDVCPDLEVRDLMLDGEKVSPFAVLKKLRQ